MPLRPFGDKLRHAIGARDISIREASRRWHQHNQHRSEDACLRSLMRYVSGRVTPTGPVRDELCDALGIDRRELPLPGEGGDQDLVADLFTQIAKLGRSLERIEGRIDHDEVPAA